MLLLNTATAPDVAERNTTVAVLPVGSFEQHGDHLPLATDTIIACVIANRIAEQHNVRVLPPVTISCSHEHAAFPGTVSISAPTLIAIIEDVRSSLQHAGIHKLVLVNGHGGNYVLSNSTQQANIARRAVALFPRSEHIATARNHAQMDTNAHDDMHAGEWETSIVLATHPELVDATYSANDTEATHRPHLLTTGIQAYTDNGIIGKPSAATAEKGEAALDSLADAFSDVLTMLSE